MIALFLLLLLIPSLLCAQEPTSFPRFGLVDPRGYPARLTADGQLQLTVDAPTALPSNKPGGSGFPRQGFVDPSTNTGLKIDADGKIHVTLTGVGAGTGNVVGPPSTVDSQVALFDSTTGMLLKTTGPGLLPTLVGGSGVASSLTLQSTTGAGTTDTIAFKLGNNGANRIFTLSNAGTGALTPLEATGADTHIGLWLKPKGKGFLAIGPSTFDIAGWAGQPTMLEAYWPGASSSLAPFGAYIHVDNDDTDSSGLTVPLDGTYGLYVTTTANGVTQNQGKLTGGFFGANSKMAVGRTINNVFAVQGNAYNSQAGTVSQAVGVNGYFESSAGTTTTGMAGRFETLVSAGAVTHLPLIEVVAASVTGGTVTNIYGARIQNQTGATNNYGLYLNQTSTGTNNFALYQVTASIKSYFNGLVGFGTTTPTNRISLTGQAAQTTGMERHATADTAGNTWTLLAGGATSGATNKNGGDLLLSSGTATGTGSSNIQFQVATAGGSGTTDRSPATLMFLSGAGRLGLGTSTPSTILSASGQTAQTFGLERHATSNTAGNTLTVQASGATSGATDKNGGDLILASGIATGSGSANIQFQTATAGGAGTADRSPATLMFLSGAGRLGLGTSTPSTILSASGQAAQTFGLERHTTGNTAGNALTVQAGGATSGATDKAGGTLVLKPGIATGDGASVVELYGVAATQGAGTTDRSPTLTATVSGSGLGIMTAPTAAIALEVNGTRSAGPSAFLYNTATVAGGPAALLGTLHSRHTSGSHAFAAAIAGEAYQETNGGNAGYFSPLSGYVEWNGNGTANVVAGLILYSNVRTAGTVTLNAGLYLEAQTSGSTNYPIYSAGTAASHFGGPIQIDNPATQVIAGGNTITADACGTIKNISSASAVTTNTTNTFTAPAAANKGCVMTVCNVNAADTITLDKNANFLSTGGADVLLLANSCIEVISTGASGVWRQTTALQTSS